MTSIKIEIPESQVKYLRGYYESQIEQIQNKINESERELGDLSRLLAQLDVASNNGKPSNGKASIKSNLVNMENNRNGYSAKWTLIKKIAFVMENKNTALTGGQLVDIIVSEFEPKLEKDRAKLYKSITGTLTNNSRKEDDI